MDKSWMQLSSRWSSEYEVGVKSFIEFAKNSVDSKNRIPCPCRLCNNVYFQKLNTVEDHLVESGIMPDYTCWIHHGEPFVGNYDGVVGNGRVEVSDNDIGDDHDFPLYVNDDMQGMIENVYAGSVLGNNMEEDEARTRNPITEEESKRFSRLLEDAKREAYPGCKKYSKLSALVRLLHIKTSNNWSNKSVDQLFEFLTDFLPPGGTLPTSYREAKTLMRDLGLTYTKIDACKFNCILYRKEYKDLDSCPKCGESRWETNTSSQCKKVPQKVLRYFPLKPRLQRLFMSKKIAEDMRWHKEKHVEEENLCKHPVDSETWKDFDKRYKWFARDPRNIRLGLATDGFNPFGNMSNSYSMWPVVLTPYNLPPWMCMKEPFFFLCLLIPGPESPGNDIDVYLQPLIEELNELWEEGIDTYDAFSGENFKLHAAVLWTISDFPAYAMLSGWSTKGKLACPSCNVDNDATTLKHGKKQCYRGHRRFLPTNHKWRKSRKFDGKVEHREKPRELSGEDVLQQVQNISFPEFGKAPNVRKRKRSESDLSWRKRSIFFELPYWSKLKLRHNIDVMHVEKNICESILATLMNTAKTKDNDNARLDLELMGLRKELHLQEDGDSYTKPNACYTLDVAERKRLCEWLKTVKFPDGYASNINRCVVAGGSKISGMKSHDCHVFLQKLLPTAIRGFLRNDVYIALTELSVFFKELCSRTLRMDVLEKMEKDIVLILCKLEMIYPPAFFDIMIHLTVHLPHEAKIAGPVQYRWMYPVERYLRTLKRYVRNKAHPEGSIAEAYIDNECLTFCSLYLKGVETQFDRVERNDDERQGSGFLNVFTQGGRPLGSPKAITLGKEDFNKIRWFVLNNCPEVEPYMQLHKEELSKENKHNIQKRHEELFAGWFERHIKRLRRNGSVEATDDLYSLCCGPDERAERYYGCNVNGIRFHTQDHERTRKTQNSGVLTIGEHQSEDIDFYGCLQDVIEVVYIGGRHVVLFKCDWYNVGDKRNGIQKDNYLVSVNVSRTWYVGDPYILASQAEQVFYLDDTSLGKGWKVVQKIQPRAVFDVPEVEIDKVSSVRDDLITDDDAYQQSEPDYGIGVQEVDENYNSLNRGGSTMCTVEASYVRSSRGVINGEEQEDEEEWEEEEEEEEVVEEEEQGEGQERNEDDEEGGGEEDGCGDDEEDSDY